jgi:hypothetical protein
VYQAFKPAIGRYAVAHQRFTGCPDYSVTRMTWIKTNFLWMMFRCALSLPSGSGVEVLMAVVVMPLEQKRVGPKEGSGDDAGYLVRALLPELLISLRIQRLILWIALDLFTQAEAISVRSLHIARVQEGRRRRTPAVGPGYRAPALLAHSRLFPQQLLNPTRLCAVASAADHHPSGEPVPSRRAIQLGLKNVASFASGEDILRIDDLTPFVAECARDDLAKLVTPKYAHVSTSRSMLRTGSEKQHV